MRYMINGTETNEFAKSKHARLCTYRTLRNARKAMRKLIQQPWNGRASYRNDAFRALNNNANARTSHSVAMQMFPGLAYGTTMKDIMWSNFNTARSAFYASRTV